MNLPRLYTFIGVGIDPREPGDDTIVDPGLARKIEIRLQLEAGPALADFDAGIEVP